MSLSVLLEIIAGVLKFPSEVTALIRLLSKSSEEKRQAIMADMQAQLQGFLDDGRPR